MAGTGLKTRQTRSTTGRLRLALLAGTVLAFNWAVPAVAQTASPARTTQQSISVPAGPLTPALNQLAAQGGLQILYDADLAQGKTTRGVRGTLSPAQALDAVLAGTGLSAQFAGANQVVLSLNTAPAGEGDPIAGDVTILDTIRIYGARDATTLESTSASVGIVTSREIESGQIRDVRQAFRRLGNVMDNASIDSGFSIRGLSSEGFVPSNSLVGSLYVDGVLQTLNGARRGARSLYDVEQVEVYRGPQSTLSGRAAMAGAIYIKSKDPTFDQEAELSGTVGSDNLVGTAFMVNTPALNDQIAIRISGAFERFRESQISFPSFESFDRLDDLKTDQNYFIRGKVLIAPSELPDTRALLSYSYSRDSPYAREIGAGAGFDFEDNRGDFHRFPAFAEVRTTRVHNAGLEVTHDFSDLLRFTSLTALHRSHNERPSVNEGTPGEISVTYGDQYDTLLTQELRLNYEGDRWQWVGGVYGSYQHYDTLVNTTLFPRGSQGERVDRKTTNLAAFGEATYEFVPSWKFTLGGRLDYSYIDANIVSSQTPWGGPTFEVENPAEFEEVNFVPKIGLSKDIAEGHTLGVTYSQGFRTGGYFINYRTGGAEYYDPETAHSYELFYKGRLLDERLTLNANLFYTQYKDQQIEIRPDPSDPFYRETSNAAASRAWGFEIEPTWQVSDQFTAFTSIGYVNTRFSEFNHADYGDLAGSPFPEAPEWTIGLGGQYEFQNGFYLGGDAKYTSAHLARFGVAPQHRVDSRIIVNAQAGYRKDNWEINAFAENLLDERYFLVADRDGSPPYAELGARRSFGLNIKARF